MRFVLHTMPPLPTSSPVLSPFAFRLSPFALVLFPFLSSIPLFSVFYPFYSLFPLLFSSVRPPFVLYSFIPLFLCSSMPPPPRHRIFARIRVRFATRKKE